MSVKLSESTAMVLHRHLRREWASGECTAELDAAMRILDGQLYDRSSMPDRDNPVQHAESHLAAGPVDGCLWCDTWRRDLARATTVRA